MLEFLDAYNEEKDEQNLLLVGLGEKELVRKVIQNINKQINPSSARNWINNMNKEPGYFLELRRKVKTKDKGKQILKAARRFKYSNKDE